MVRSITRLEGLTIFLLSLIFYHYLSANWILFFLAFLAPDLSMVGYLVSKQLGAITYNTIHNYVSAIFIIGLAVLIHNQILLECGLILACHVGIDRFFGFGLKYPKDFKDTHIQRL